MKSFHIEVTPDGDGSRIIVSGELDMMAAPQLRRTILDAHDRTGGDVTLDLGPVTFIDSTGLAVLLVTKRMLGQSRARLILTNVSTRVTALLEITGIDSHFDIDPDPSPSPAHTCGRSSQERPTEDVT